MQELITGLDAKYGEARTERPGQKSWIKDLGFIGMPKGWKVVVGGSAGAAPAIAEVLAENLNYDEAIDTADGVINYYKNCDTKKRLGRYIKEIGFEEFKREIL